MPNIRHDSILIFSLGISIFGLLIVLMLAFNPPTIHENFFWRKPLVGSIFSLICVLGIFAALFPRQCSQLFHFHRESGRFTSHQIYTTSHHPDCKEFSAHVVHISNHTLCAACIGLLFGALVALIGAVFYFFGGWHTEEVGFPIVLIGTVGMVLGFLQFKFRNFVRLTLNAFFVLGAFLILVGIDGLTESLFIDLFLVAFLVFWILARIQFSQWDHWRICNSCKFPCEFREIKK
jgi:hypothetical protein